MSEPKATQAPDGLNTSYTGLGGSRAEKLSRIEAMGHNELLRFYALSCRSGEIAINLDSEWDFEQSALKVELEDRLRRISVPPIGTKVRVLKAYDPKEGKLIEGRVGIVADCPITKAIGAVDFRGKVTREHSYFPGWGIRVRKIFLVSAWEFVPKKTLLGPERHYRLKRKKRAK